MVIIVYASETDQTIQDNIGAPDYSYYFVLKKFYTVLSKLAHVIEVKNPEEDVDVIYRSCRARGETCLLLSFSPPFKTVTSLECPAVSVFAWEFKTIPTDSWGDDPRSDWRYVFRKHGSAITHSSFAVDAVKEAMGSDFPVWSIPAPVWDRYKKIYSKKPFFTQSKALDLNVNGTLIDIRGCDVPYVAPENRDDFVEKRTSRSESCQFTKLALKGIIYTSVFNPSDGRKNWEDLVKGFIWALREVENVTLLLKVVHYDFEEARRLIITEIFKLTPFKCRIIILHGYLDDGDYAELVRATTYVVNTARGEGQCLPLMEFMSAGKPAIAPAHSAMKDYITGNNAFVVKSSLERAQWPPDPRYALRTLRYRIDWESVYNAYLESYHVALHDPARYEAMSCAAVQSLKKYCSQAVAKKRLKMAFRQMKMPKEGMLFAAYLKVRHRGADLIRLMRLSLLKRGNPASMAGHLSEVLRTKGRHVASRILRPLITMHGLFFAQKDAGTPRVQDQAPGQPISTAIEAMDSTLVDATLSGWFKSETGELIEGFQILQEDILLDAGCGNTPFLNYCANQGAEIIFADIDARNVAAMMERLKNSAARSVKGFVSDACALPLNDASVTKILAMEVMEHVADPVALMKELVRVGKPGAQYLITVPDPVAETLQIKLAPRVYFEKPNHIRIVGREEFEQIVVDAGLIIEQRRFVGFYWALWWLFFWTCGQEPVPPWHPLLENWRLTWKQLLETPDGPKVKRVLDEFMPKTQVIIARKPI